MAMAFEIQTIVGGSKKKKNPSLTVLCSYQLCIKALMYAQETHTWAYLIRSVYVISVTIKRSLCIYIDASKAFSRILHSTWHGIPWLIRSLLCKLWFYINIHLCRLLLISKLAEIYGSVWTRLEVHRWGKLSLLSHAI